jgi:hypothetical protein
MNIFGRPKPKGKLPEDASTLIRAVFTLDALRVGIFAPELRKLHQSLRETHFLSTEGVSWSAIRREINELINFPEKSDRTTRYVRRLPFLNILLLVGFGATAASAIVDLYVIRQFPLYTVILPGLVFMSAVSTVRWYYEDFVRSYFENTKPRAERIRRLNNQIIEKLIFILQKAEYPLDDCTFALYNADYQNIGIKSKPKIYRGYYEVYPKSLNK